MICKKKECISQLEETRKENTNTREVWNDRIIDKSEPAGAERNALD